MNEAAFMVVKEEKIYAHKPLTFNDIVACEVISKWKAELKEEIDARSNVYVLINVCKESSDDRNGYYRESTPGMVFSYMCKAEILIIKGLLDERSSWIRV
nr:zinc finger, CCHC-type [Tanacetum cinerariifolium]